MKNLSICRFGILLLISIALLPQACSRVGTDDITILYDFECSQVQFAVGEIIKSLKADHYNVESAPLGTAGDFNSGSRIIIGSISDDAIINSMEKSGQSPSENLTEEGFCIKTAGNGSERSVWVVGADKAGAMYGGLELAEQVKIYGLEEVKETEKNPYMRLRGTKFNIPLDVRTPSYTDPCDAAQQNIIEMWNFDFWVDYLDNLAKNRYNYVSLWSLHPFPSMVMVPDYPDIALDDVQRSKVEWEEYYSTNGLGFDAPEIINNVEVLKEITIEDKIAFWQKVMTYGKSRNIDFYVVTWNIFVNGTKGQYGITDKISNETTKDYFRKSVRQMFLTYPYLAGIGLTTGEN
ncbi:alpha-glucuronidase family glycosyl hydrolase, partial [Bacteroidota bacterium]